jgi:hypothetical protein
MSKKVIVNGEPYVLLSPADINMFKESPEVMEIINESIKKGEMESFNVLFVGDYFSMTVNIFTEDNGVEWIAEVADKLIRDYHGFSPMSQAFQVEVRTESGEMLGEVEL